jgi:Fur family ferric uptake transcriptional regulator
MEVADAEKDRRVDGEFWCQALLRVDTKGGSRLTPQRWLIISALIESGSHFTVEGLFHHVRRIDPRVGHSTVYRTLKLLSDAGLVLKQRFSDGLTRYELALGGLHDHLICTKCGTVAEFRDLLIEEHQQRVATAHHFQVTSHEHKLYGICAKCRTAQRPCEGEPNE